MSYANKLNILKITHHLGAVAALFLFKVEWLYISILMYFVFQVLGANIAMHRYLAHKTFRCGKFVDQVLSVLANLIGFGSSMIFVAFHRAHHANSDSATDPHSPDLGLTAICLGKWRSDRRLLVHARDLLNQPVHKFFHEHYFKTVGALYFVVGLISPHALVFAICVPLVMVFWSSIGLTYLCHVSGYKNYPHLGAYNNVFVNLITLGDGLHNNHHEHPDRYNQAESRAEFDPTGLLIRIFIFLGFIEANKQPVR